MKYHDIKLISEKKVTLLLESSGGQVNKIPYFPLETTTNFKNRGFFSPADKIKVERQGFKCVSLVVLNTLNSELARPIPAC